MLWRAPPLSFFTSLKNDDEARADRGESVFEGAPHGAIEKTV